MTSFFEVEYARSKRSTCKQCKENIPQDEIRIGSSVDDGDSHKRTTWYHLDCWKIPKKIKDIDDVQGYENLEKSDKKIVKDYLKDSNNKIGSAKWKKVQTKGAKIKKADPKTKKVAEVLKSYTNHELKKFLNLNDQKISGTKPELCLRIADGMLYGVLP
eukprot:gene12975-7633_t